MNGNSAHDDLVTRKVAGEAKRRARRKRTTGPTRLRKINAKAREREVAWLQSDHANVVEGLTVDLENLYDDLRVERAGDPGSPYRGTTTNVRRWESKRGLRHDASPVEEPGSGHDHGRAGPIDGS